MFYFRNKKKTIQVLGGMLGSGYQAWAGDGGAHLGLVQGLSLVLAPLCNLLILNPHGIDDAVQIQGAVIVHGQDDVGVGDVGLHLRQLLQGMEHRLTSSTPLPGPQFPSMPPNQGSLGKALRITVVCPEGPSLKLQASRSRLRGEEGSLNSELPIMPFLDPPSLLTLAWLPS